MRIPEVIKVLRVELECIDRQNTPKCNRKCRECDLVMAQATVREAYSTAITALEYLTKICKGGKDKNGNS